jgi:hydroxymethylpyrimidine pyrophosphatase-like HAD family hydrolase
MLLEPLAITTPVCGFNGGVIAMPDLSVITEHLLSPEIAWRAVDMLDAKQVRVWVFSGQDWLVRDPHGPYVGLEEHTVEFRPTVVANFGHVLDAAAKIVGVSKDFELLAQCSKICESRWLIKLPSLVLSLTTSTLPIRLPTRVPQCRNSRDCWLFRWRRSPSSATAATM